MGDHSKEFPDINSKLSAPKTLSAYGKEKQAQEAKRQRAEIEDAEALKRFEEEFGGSEEGDTNASGSRTPYNGTSSEHRGYGGTLGRFGGQLSGPRGMHGGLGMLPGPPPPSLKRKRAMEEAREAEAARREEEWFTEDRTRNDGVPREVSEEPNDTAPKPTVQLSYLPPGTTEETIVDLLQPYVEVHSVEIIPAMGLKQTDTAVATLEHVVKQEAIGDVVKDLNRKYLGGGRFLSIARHLSSTALRPNVSLGTIGTSSDEPFGAKKLKTTPGNGSLRNAPPPSQFAPPGSFDSRSPGNLQAERMVPVSTSLDSGTFKAIHVITDHLLSEPDAGRALQIEALLMNDPSIYRDERFAFLYDSHSPAGVYYRYLLWLDHSLDAANGHSDRLEARLFNDVHYDWPLPNPSLPFVGLSRLGDVMDSADYNSDAEESDDENGGRQFNSGAREGPQGAPTDGERHLSPSQQARLAWLLAGVSATHTMLRIIEVANITNFAIAHANAGAERIVDLLTLNVQKPFSSLFWAKEGFEGASDEDISDDQAVGFEPRVQADGSAGVVKQDADDPSHAKLVGLYIINDILMNAVISGVTGAWKYRQLFESSFMGKKTFEYLGQLDKELGWGRMRAEQWKNKVTFLLEAWEKHNVFSKEGDAELRNAFLGRSGDDRNEPATPNSGNQTPKPDALPKISAMNRFKKIDGSTSSAGNPVSHTPLPSSSNPPGQHGNTDHHMPDAQHEAHGLPGEILSDTPMRDRESVPLTSDSVTSTHNAGQEPSTGGGQQKTTRMGFSMSMKPVASKDDVSGAKVTPGDSKRRMRAEDMFADSDEE